MAAPKVRADYEAVQAGQNLWANAMACSHQVVIFANGKGGAPLQVVRQPLELVTGPLRGLRLWKFHAGLQNVKFGPVR